MGAPPAAAWPAASHADCRSYLRRSCVACPDAKRSTAAPHRPASTQAPRRWQPPKRAECSHPPALSNSITQETLEETWWYHVADIYTYETPTPVAIIDELTDLAHFDTVQQFLRSLDQRFAARHKRAIFRHHTQITLRMVDRPLVDVVVELKLPPQFFVGERALFAERLGPQDMLLAVIRAREHIHDHEALRERDPLYRLN
jgi:hypothetical protein